MLKRVLFLAMVLLIATVSANAQDHPKVEMWGTYSLLVADIDVLDNETLHGYGLGIQGNLTKNFGLVFEFTSNHGASGPVTIFPPVPPVILIPELDTKTNYFLFGPRFSYRPKAVTVYGHALFGGASSRIRDEKGTSGFNEGNTEFAYAIGGGIDVNLSKHYAIRAGQFDWAPIHTDVNTRFTRTGTVDSSSSWLHNVRFQAGFVFKL